MTDVYQNWRDRLAGKDVPTHADHPDPGYYKVRDGRDGPWKPCAIWYPAGSNELFCRVGGEARDPLATWTFAVKNPIPKEVAKFAFDKGFFPDEPKPTVRGNMPADPFEALVAEIEDKSAQAENLLKQEITSQQTCDLARNMQAQLLALNKRADAMHKAEKAPILEAERAIETKFTFRKNVASIAFALREKFERWMRAEERRQQEDARRQFEAVRAAAEAERQRLEAERAKQREDDPVAFHTSPEPELPEMPVAPEPVKVQAGGGFGRKAGLKSVWVPVVTDYKAALAHFADNAKVKELIQKLGEQAVKAGARDVPGFDIKEDRRAA